MVRFHVWTKGQAVTILLGTLLLTALMAAGVALLWQGSRVQTQPDRVTAVFAETDMLFPVEGQGLPETEITPAPPEKDTALHVEVIRETAVPAAKERRVLIYHSHTWEAFAQVKDAPYQATEKWRTKDNTANIVAVGNALAASLEAMGCSVVHDITAFEPPDLSSAYERSLAMLEQRASRGETYDLYIDLHRDAIASASTIKRTVNIGGEEVARFMVLIGKGVGFNAKPDWEANFALAEIITQSLNRQTESLCRDIKVKTGRFNQHIAPRCVLIECGNNENTLEQVINGIPYLTQAIMDALNTMPTE